MNQSTASGLLDRAGFSLLRLGTRRLYVCGGLASRGNQLTERLLNLCESRAPGMGNRGSGYALDFEGSELFVRLYRRGGMLAHLIRDHYFGLHPRPFAELAITIEAARRGVAVAEPIAAMVCWVAPLVYQGAFVSRRITAVTLWHLLQQERDRAIRESALRAAMSAIDTMHRAGLEHDDLNLQNLLIGGDPLKPAVTIVDLDKARLHPGRVPASHRRANHSRMARSVRKLVASGATLDPSELRLITGA